MTTLTVRTPALSLRRLRTIDPLLAVLVVVCGLLALLAAFGPFLTPYPPDQTDVLAASQGPSAQHLLGTDALGRDIVSRLMAGASLSFAGPLLIVSVSIVAGTALALVSAWHGGATDGLISRALNVVFAVPGILVAVIAVAIFGTGFWAPVLALSVVYIPYVARVVRAAAVEERKRAYIESLQLAGVSAMRINIAHILPNVSPIILAQATFGIGASLIDFGAISFLGLGVQPPVAEWGLMVAEGRSEMLEGAVQQSLSAGVLIVITVVAFNMLGERLTHHFGAAR